MSKSRKVLGALLAVVMVLSVLSISAFAAGGTSYEEDPSAYSQRWSLGTPSGDGSTYTVEVFLSTDYPVGPVAFRLVGANVLSVTGGTEYYSNPLTTVSDTGMVLMIPNTSDTVPAHSVNGLIATVTYTTSNANGAVTLEKSAKTADSPNGTLVAARCTAGTVNASDFVVGQYTYVNGELLNEGTTPPPATATLTGVNGGFVDEARGYVYGVPLKTANPATYFSTTGYVELVDNSNDAKYGTGDTLNLYTDSSKGTLVKSYKIVMFGDLDGNGDADVTDFGIMEKHVTASLLIEDPVVMFAADVDSPAENVTAQSIDVTDFGTMEKHVTAALLLSSNVRAA